MIREAEKSLKIWKERKKHKPMLLTGARQVGKTWLMKNLGTQLFDNFIYINFEKEQAYKNLFQQDLNVNRIVQTLSIMSNQPIVDGKTLVIFDEIQEAQNALTCLKYFEEDRPNLHVIAAGSLLGVSFDSGSFPVGKVDFLAIHPMSFSEFLSATGELALCGLLEQDDYNLISNFSDKLIRTLKTYYLVGGMPEAVLSFSENPNNLEEVKQIQGNILGAYLQDFAKHAPTLLIPKIVSIWNGLVSQLAKENRKFVYGLLKQGARAREYEQAIDWLEKYGLVHRVFAINKLASPLQAYRDSKNFKLYVLDVGLLSHMANLNPNTVLENPTFFQEFKGALTEQYVLQELWVNGAKNISYWTNENGTAEVDFIFEKNGKIYPLEVKASENLQAKSLRVLHDKHPYLHCYRSSLSNFRQETWLTNIPLYAVAKINS